MPIYEYFCESCRRKVSVFRRTVSSTATPVCPNCQSENLRRLVSQFAVLRSDSDFNLGFDEGMLDEMADLDESDPAAMAEWARRLQRQMGDDLGPEFSGMIDELESGGLEGE
jgi:putative FmdB family regulatory protein